MHGAAEQCVALSLDCSTKTTKAPAHADDGSFCRRSRMRVYEPIEVRVLIVNPQTMAVRRDALHGEAKRGGDQQGFAVK